MENPQALMVSGLRRMVSDFTGKCSPNREEREGGEEEGERRRKVEVVVVDRKREGQRRRWGCMKGSQRGWYLFSYLCLASPVASR